MSMILYHTCTIPVYNLLMNRGYLNGPAEFADEDFSKDQGAYQWMVEQMHLRLPKKPSLAAEYPVWAWYHFEEGIEEGMGHELTFVQEPSICLKFKIDKELVLLSDYELWHFVLNNDIITSTEDEWDIHTKLWRDPTQDKEKLRLETRSSWVRIFDMDRPYMQPDWSGSKAEMVQAILNQVNRRLSIVGGVSHLTFQSTMPTQVAQSILDRNEHPDLLELAKVLIRKLL